MNLAQTAQGGVERITLFILRKLVPGREPKVCPVREFALRISTPEALRDTVLDNRPG